jgi:hypothetical protein
MPVDDKVDDSRNNSKTDIEKPIRDIPDRRTDGISENPEEQHIPQQMKKTAMQEHISQ